MSAHVEGDVAPTQTVVKATLTAMPYPRSHLVDNTSSGVYHVQSRCVRRAWLCGADRETGRDFSHRRDWIERRILKLADIFSISIYGYAVMSNHYHVVLEIRPQEASRWSDEEVVDRWLSLCPGRRPVSEPSVQMAARRKALLADSTRIEELRIRLASLSWFMRFINEPLARIANREDDCTGRFWQGRFSSQRLLDEAAVLAAMVYVDLNPVRAGIADDLTECRHTSIHARLARLLPKDTLKPLNSATSRLCISRITLEDYVSLVCWTADRQRGIRKAGSVAPQSLSQRQIDEAQWIDYYIPRPGRYRRAIGSLRALKQYAEGLGQRWIQVGYVAAPP